MLLKHIEEETGSMKKLFVGLMLAAGLVSTANAVEGNAEAGQTKAAMCAACHGADGNSLVPIYPKLAGQGAKYTAKQLADFKAGAMSGGQSGRNNAIMGGMVMGLSEQDMADLAAYFEGQTRSQGTGTANDAGHKLYISGDAERKITACAACHSADGKGMPSAGFPSLNAQNVDYLKAQLTAFRSGERVNDPNSMMRDIAKKLSDQDIENLAQFIASMK
jgi:cytochrome c553